MGLANTTSVKDWFDNNQGWNPKYVDELEKPGLNKTGPSFGDPSFADLIRQLVADLKTRDEMLASYANVLTDNGQAGGDGAGNGAGRSTNGTNGGTNAGTGGGASTDNRSGDKTGKEGDAKTKDSSKSKDTPKPPERPKVPVGKPIDISAGELKIDDVSWQIPTFKTSDSSEATLTANDLDDWQWLAVMKGTNALYGTRLDTLLRGAMAASNRTPLMFRLPGHNDWWQAENSSRQNGTLDYSKSTHEARSQGFFSAEIGGSYAFCSASAAVSHATASVSQTAERRTYMTGYWRVPRAKVSLRDCTVVSPHFVDAARRALAAPKDSRYAVLTRLFEDFGHVYYPTLILGGTAYFQTSRVASASSTDQSVKDTVAAAAKYKSPDGAGAEATSEYQRSDGSKETGQQLAESVSWTMIGGRSELNGDVARWLPTVSNAKNWSLVDREGGPLSTISLLPDELQAAIRAAWKEELRNAWGVTDDRQVPSSTTYPHFRGQPVVLRTSRQLESGRQRVLRARPEPASSDDNSALARSYPGRVQESHASLPDQNHLYWRFVYAGSHSDGVPHYRILSDDGAHALSTVREGDGMRHVILVTVSAAAALKDPAALWMVHAADPGQRFGDTFSGEWLLQHAGSRWFVGRPETWGNGKVRTVLRNVSDRLRAGSLKPGAPSPWDLRDYCWRIYDPLDTSWQG